MAWKEVFIKPTNQNTKTTHISKTVKGEAFSREQPIAIQAVIILDPPYLHHEGSEKPESWWKSFQPLNFNSVPRGTWGQTAGKGSEVCGHVGVAFGSTHSETELINGLRLKLAVYN